MMKKYNVAVIGSGSIANKFHIPAFKKNKKIKEVILFDINKKNLKISSRIHKIKSVYSNFEKMLLKKKVDIFAICTPPFSHVDYIVKAIKKNINIFVEKPFVINLKQLELVEKTLRKTKVHYYCAYHQRTRPISEEIKQIINKNRIGKIYYIKIIHRQFRSVPKSKFLSVKKYSGGGPLIDLGSHYFDLVGWFLRFPKIKKVSNYCFYEITKKTKEKNYLPFKEYNNEELSVGNIQLGNNCIVSYEIGYVLNTKDEIKSIQFFGDKGSVIWPQGNIEILKKNKIKKKKIKPKNYLASRKQVDNFLNNINKKFSLSHLKQIKFSVDLIEKLYKFKK